MIKKWIISIIEEYCRNRVYSKIGPLEAQIGPIQKKLETMYKCILDNEKEFQSIEERFQSIEERFQSIEERFQLFKENLEHYKTSQRDDFIALLDSHSKEVDFRLASLSVDTKKDFIHLLDSRIKDLQRDCLVFKKEFDALPDFTGLVTQIDSYSIDISNLYKSVKNLKQNQTKLVKESSEGAINEVIYSIEKKKKLYVLLKDTFKNVFLRDVLKELLPQIKSPSKNIKD